VAQEYEDQTEEQYYEEQAYDNQAYYQTYQEPPQAPTPNYFVAPPSQTKQDPYMAMAAAMTSLASKLDHLKE
jgi:hypothetical protein